MKIGINKISFYVPKHYLDLNTLAKARGVDPLKYINGLYTEKMAIASEDEDIVTMAANATKNILTDEDIESIDLILFSTESGLDYSKAASTHLISLLGLKNKTRALELKQACYSATAALYFAKGHILQNPNSRVLVIASDISRYGLNSSGEPTQGAGAVSMIISRNPKIMVLNNQYGLYSEDVYDFWRPNGFDFACVDGKFSNETYKKLFLETFGSYKSQTNVDVNDFTAINFHIPYGKLALRSLQLVANEKEQPKLFENFDASIKYNKVVGNIYTGSLFLSLISLLDHAKLKAKDLIGLFSYGSGAVGEFFTGTIVPGYKKHIEKTLHKNIVKRRVKLSIAAYEKMIEPIGSFDQVLNHVTDGYFRLEKIENNQRFYVKTT